MAGQEDDFAEIIRLLKQISEKLDKPCSCGPKDGTQTFPNPFPNPVVGPLPCTVCGLGGVNGFACMRSDCPTAIRSTIPFGSGGIVPVDTANAAFIPAFQVISDIPNPEVIPVNREPYGGNT